MCMCERGYMHMVKVSAETSEALEWLVVNCPM